jgi:hypothetical protein
MYLRYQWPKNQLYDIILNSHLLSIIIAIDHTYIIMLIQLGITAILLFPRYSNYPFVII